MLQGNIFCGRVLSAETLSGVGCTGGEEGESLEPRSDICGDGASSSFIVLDRASLSSPSFPLTHDVVSGNAEDLREGVVPRG